MKITLPTPETFVYYGIIAMYYKNWGIKFRQTEYVAMCIYT